MLINTPIGKNFPAYTNCIVEIPKDTSAKYEYDVETNLFKLDRYLISSMRYPVNYGFIPQTIAQDGDPLDIMIHSSLPIERGTLVECKILGCMNMVDHGVNDYKILGVPAFNFNNYTEYTDLDKVALHIFEDFFRNYKNLEGKIVAINNWTNRQETLNIIKKYHSAYVISR